MKASQFGAVLSTAALLAAISAPAFAEDNVTTVTQTTTATETSASGIQVTNAAATLANNVLQAAAGNIGANVASGIANQQANVTRINSNGNENDITTTQSLGHLENVSIHGATVTNGTVEMNSEVGHDTRTGGHAFAANSSESAASAYYHNTQKSGNSGFTFNAAANQGTASAYNYAEVNNKGNASNFSNTLNLGRNLSETHNANDTSSSSYGYNNTNTDGTSGTGNGSGQYVYGYNNHNTGSSLANNAGNGAGSGSFGYNYTLSATDTSNGNGSKAHAFQAAGTNTESASASFGANGTHSYNASNYENGNGSHAQASNAYLNIGVASTYVKNNNSAGQRGFAETAAESNNEAWANTETWDKANTETHMVTRTFQSDGGAVAGIGDNVGQAAAGNIGMNVAAGAFNNQANVAVISAASCSCGASSGAVTVKQTIGDVSDLSTYNTAAYASGNALQNAAGNIGLNIASGIGNQQSNTLSLQP